jgi:DeoR family fructose operon transcriptional repressor
MLAEERRSKISQILGQRSSVTIAELVKRFGTSEMTIRRDLDALEARGVCQRIHGGAMSMRMTEYSYGASLPFASRQKAQVKEKIAIAQAAAAYVRPGDVIAIDAGTTAAYLAYQLRERDSVTVVTNSVAVLAQLYDVTGITLNSCGGTLSLESLNEGGGDLAFVGPVTVAALRNYRPNKAFITASGITLRDGISNAGTFQAEIKRTLIDISEEVILIADYKKFGQSSGFIVAGLDKFQKVITDTAIPERYVREMRALAIEVVLVEPAQESPALRPSLFFDPRAES